MASGVALGVSLLEYHLGWQVECHWEWDIIAVGVSLGG